MASISSDGGEVLKVDTLGRVRVSRERWEQLLWEFANSGISARHLQSSVAKACCDAPPELIGKRYTKRLWRG